MTFTASISEALPTPIWSEVIIRGEPVYSEGWLEKKLLGAGIPQLESVSRFPLDTL